MTTAIVSEVRQLLKWSLGLAAIVVGGDKFLNVITDWQKYVSEPIRDLLPIDVQSFLLIVGVIEILVGILILSRSTQIGAYILAVWFAMIIVNLLFIGNYYDVVLRDALLAIASVGLARLYSPQLRLV